MARGGYRPNSGRKHVEGRKIQFICPTEIDSWLQTQRRYKSITDIICAALYEYKQYHDSAYDEELLLLEG